MKCTQVFAENGIVTSSTKRNLPLVGQIEKGTLIDRSCAEFLNSAHSRLSQDGVHREDGKTREPSEYLRFAVATWKQPRRRRTADGMGGKHDKKKNKDASELGELFSQKYSDPLLITPTIQESAVM